MEKTLEIFVRIVKHCDTWAEYCYLRSMSSAILSEYDFSLFLFYSSGYFGRGFFDK